MFEYSGAFEIITPVKSQITKLFLGFFQGTASEATLVGLLAARSSITSKLKENDPTIETASILDKLVAYTSDQVKYAYKFIYRFEAMRLNCAAVTSIK